MDPRHHDVEDRHVRIDLAAERKRILAVRRLGDLETPVALKGRLKITLLFSWSSAATAGHLLIDRLLAR